MRSISHLHAKYGWKRVKIKTKLKAKHIVIMILDFNNRLTCLIFSQRSISGSVYEMPKKCEKFIAKQPKTPNSLHSLSEMTEKSSKSDDLNVQWGRRRSLTRQDTWRRAANVRNMTSWLAYSSRSATGSVTAEEKPRAAVASLFVDTVNTGGCQHTNIGLFPHQTLTLVRSECCDSVTHC